MTPGASVRSRQSGQKRPARRGRRRFRTPRRRRRQRAVGSHCAVDWQGIRAEQHRVVEIDVYCRLDAEEMKWGNN